MKSAQGVYPIIPDDDTSFAFVEFVHNRGSVILQTAGDRGLLKSTCPLWRERAATLLERDQQLAFFVRTPWLKPRGKQSTSSQDSQYAS